MFDWIYALTKAAWAMFVSFVGEVLGWIFGLLLDLLVWILDLFGPILRRLFSAMATGVGEILAVLPVPGFIADLQSHWDSLPWASLVFFLSAFQVEYGFTVVTGAAVLKFVLRVLPVVGRMFG